MKISVIKTGMFEGRAGDSMKPLVFGILERLTPEDVCIQFFDDRIEDLPQILDSDIIAFSIETFSAKRAYKLAKQYKTDANIIVMGGCHPSILPKESKEYCDVVVIGDAEDTWSQLILDYKNGEIKRYYRSKPDCSLCFVNHKSAAFHGKKYLPISVVQFSRGCKFNCDFCSVKVMYPGKVRQKSWDLISLELKNIKEKLLFFSDDNLFLNNETAIHLCKLIAPLKKKWVCQISIDVCQNDELLLEMKKAGCFMLLIGFESLNMGNLKQMNKKANISIEDYEKAIKKIYSYGFLIYATFVFGYDEDDKYAFDRVLEFSEKSNFAITNFNPLIPMPETEVYRKLKKENRLIYDKWWDADNYRYGETTFHPKLMSPKELEEHALRIRTTFYGTKSILKRLLHNLKNLDLFLIFVFLTANFVSGKEIKRKQGGLIGGEVIEANTDKAKYREKRT